MYAMAMVTEVCQTYREVTAGQIRGLGDDSNACSYCPLAILLRGSLLFHPRLWVDMWQILQLNAVLDTISFILVQNDNLQKSRLVVQFANDNCENNLQNLRFFYQQPRFQKKCSQLDKYRTRLSLSFFSSNYFFVLIFGILNFRK